MRTSRVELTTTRTFDARGVAPGERDALILSTFRRLCVGESMELVHDHEPKRLFSELRAEMPGSFTWLCIEAGPQVWRVRIGRLATWWSDGQCCGTCGGRTGTAS